MRGMIRSRSGCGTGPDETAVRLLRVLLLGIVLLLSSCATDRGPVGKEFDIDRVPDLAVGVSTLDDANEVLGSEPFAVEPLDDGSTRAAWLVGRWMQWGEDGEPWVFPEKLLILRFGPEGTLQEVVEEYRSAIDPP